MDPSKAVIASAATLVVAFAFARGEGAWASALSFRNPRPAAVAEGSRVPAERPSETKEGSCSAPVKPPSTLEREASHEAGYAQSGYARQAHAK